jgi:hypothetical protein
MPFTLIQPLGAGQPRAPPAVRYGGGVDSSADLATRLRAICLALPEVAPPKLIALLDAG